MIIGQVEAVLIGKIVPFSRGQGSAINKMIMSEPQFATTVGFVGDEQADKKHHGGVEKAIHIYPSEHYTAWSERSDNTAFKVGAFGENLSSVGVDEYNICQNDIVQIGGAKLQVSQGRMPCWKLNKQFSIDDMALQVQNTLRTGWYFRVLQEGSIQAGDEIMLLERPFPELSLARIMQIFYL